MGSLEVTQRVYRSSGHARPHALAERERGCRLQGLCGAIRPEISRPAGEFGIHGGRVTGHSEEPVGEHLAEGASTLRCAFRGRVMVLEELRAVREDVKPQS